MMGSLYDWLRGLHILAVIAWMAGLLYLPRLYVYHFRAAPGSEMDATFQVMERRLLRGIMNPAMIVTWAFGLTLVWYDSTYRFGSAARFLGQPWMSAKLSAVVLLSAFHMYLAAARKRFAAGTYPKTERFWRFANEVPAVLAVIAVLAVTTEMFTR